ncbi:classical arabinogalactan protein 25 [Cucumis sativus]|uniref:Classical arabinogalactan protein 25 n=1 Tax=Cucumis sativus TaxID=3659 RepID=A0A0A0KBF8_CUCSA|nr:classical arabinogalactan protein 25 [Cucumis sativus]KGN46189.1 hypothetical protein Csa_005749 [Cucumis sativus]
MASFWYCSAVIMVFMASPLLALPSVPNPKPSSPFQELSPEIAPLLPSTGDKIPSATGSSIPTIPSNPSPPNPDDFEALGPDSSALSPFGLPGSFAPPNSLPCYSNWLLLLLNGLALLTFSMHLH